LFSRKSCWLFVHYLKVLEKSKGTIKNEQSRDTCNIGHKTWNRDKQKKKKKKMWYRLPVSEINIKIYGIIINTSQSIKSRISYNVEQIIFLEMHDYYDRVYIYLGVIHNCQTFSRVCKKHTFPDRQLWMTPYSFLFSFHLIKWKNSTLSEQFQNQIS